MAEIHLVAVDREDLFLGVALLDPHREDDLANLALDQLLLGQAELIEVARHLLRQRARALLAAPLGDVDGRRGEDAIDVQAEVLVEIGILGGDDGVAQQRIDVVVADDHAPLRRELADDLAVRRVHARDGAGAVVVERGNLREVAGVREEHAAQRAGHGRHQEQRDDARIAGYANDNALHG